MILHNYVSLLEGMIPFPKSFPKNSQVHAYLDRLAGSRPACVAANSLGRGLPPDSFHGATRGVETRARPALVVKMVMIRKNFGDDWMIRFL